MNTFEPTAPVGDPLYGTTNFMYARPTTIEAEFAAYGADNFGLSSEDIWDGAVAILVRLDGDDDNIDSLKDELDLFRRENDLDLD